MKRSVAILGSTPSFVRWAIEQPCALREIHPQRLPETTFRQLRCLREMSVVIATGHVIDNVCIHTTASSTEPESALGFPVDEIVDLHGGLENVQRTCRSCPANVNPNSSRHPNLIAGCYGWLPFDLRFDFASATASVNASATVENNTLHVNRESGESLGEQIECSILELGIETELDEHFPRTNPNWYRIWIPTTPDPIQLRLLETVFRHVIDSDIESAEVNSSRQPAGSDLARFTAAVTACRENDLRLHLELIPAGFSDGQYWTIAPHCKICKSTIADSEMKPDTDKTPLDRAPETTRNCPVCDAKGQRQNAIKLKVLGLRPYLHLQSILGASATRELLQRFESR